MAIVDFQILAKFQLWSCCYCFVVQEGPSTLTFSISWRRRFMALSFFLFWYLKPPLCSVPSVPSWHVAEGLQNKAVCRALGVFGFSEQRSCRRPKLRWDWLTRDHILNSTNGDVEVAWNKVVRRYSTYFYDVLKRATSQWRLVAWYLGWAEVW